MSTNNIIGTNGDGSMDLVKGNTISGNTQKGIILSGYNGNTIAGNKIGTDPSDLGNQESGIYLGYGHQNLLGENSNGVSDAAKA